MHGVGRCRLQLGGKKIGLRGGGGGVTRRPIFPTPRPPSLAAMTGGGGSGRGCPTCRAGGGVNPTSMAQNDTHVALIILTAQMWGGGLLVENPFSGQNLCSCAFGANIRSYTKQRARHGTPFLQPPPPPPSAGVHVTPPPPPQSNFQVALPCPSNISAMHPASSNAVSPSNRHKANGTHAVSNHRRSPPKVSIHQCNAPGTTDRHAPTTHHGHTPSSQKAPAPKTATQLQHQPLPCTWHHPGS